MHRTIHTHETVANQHRIISENFNQGPVMKPARHMKHTDLFIVRFWTQDSNEQVSNSGNSIDWHGKVQRVVDGESHEFTDWDALVATLRSMISVNSPNPSTNTQADLPNPKEEQI